MDVNLRIFPTTGGFHLCVALHIPQALVMVVGFAMAWPKMGTTGIKDTPGQLCLHLALLRKPGRDAERVLPKFLGEAREK